ncbi:MAG: RluA family pseudouridine synthase [Pseudomonadota bacterium]
MTFALSSVYTALMTELSALAGENDKGTRLDRFLSEQFEALSRSRAKTLIKEGHVRQRRGGDDSVQNDPKTPTIPGVEYTVLMPDPVPAVPEPEDIPLDVLFEDEHLILINKASGMAVHPAPGTWQGTLVNALLHHCKGQLPGIGGVERPGIVHRIDKETTGVLVVAKTEAAHKGLSDLFAKHDIDRTYLALTRGRPRPSAGTIMGDIARSPRDRKKMAVVPDGDGRHAVTHYKTLESFGEISKSEALPAAALIECKLETGRTHQIRVHLAHLGYSLIGDPVYGRHRGIKAYGSGPDFDAATSLARKLTRQALHAASLGFKHPVTGEHVFVETPLPDDLATLHRALKRL